jgi:RecJ-like exonuclease
MESIGGNFDEITSKIADVMFNGNSKTENFKLAEFPNFVKVTLTDGEEACDNCHGSPIRVVFDDLIEIIDDCEYCKGTGYKIDVCLKCSGTGVIDKKINTMMIETRDNKEALVHQVEKIKCPTCKGTGEYMYRPNFPKHPKGLPCPHCTPKDEHGHFIKDEDRKIPKGKVSRVVSRSSIPNQIFCCSVCGGTGKKKVKKSRRTSLGETRKSTRKTVPNEHVQAITIATDDAQISVATASK